jgi:hypothetical protein
MMTLLKLRRQKCRNPEKGLDKLVHENIIIGVSLFYRISAIVYGIIIILQPNRDTMQLPSKLLNQLPFKEFTIPGIILCIAGVCNVAAFFLIIRR